MTKLKVIELFAGIGSYSKALKRLNVEHEVVSAIEFDAKTINNYNLIHTTNYNSIDITIVDEKILPDCDLICYSPPCQAFSSAGKRLGFEDKRGILFFHALRIIKEKKPKYCVMENVKGLTQKKLKNEFKEMLDELKLAGYNNYWKVINAKDHNIPQNRERVFIISIRKDIDDGDFVFPESHNTEIKLKDIIEDIVDDKYDFTDSMKERLVNSKRVEKYINGVEIVYNQSGGARMGYTVFGINGIAPTLTSSTSRHYERYMVKDRFRRLTPLTYFRLMGFDDYDYHVLKENNVLDSQIYKVAGNSIVVDVLVDIFSSLFSLNT